MTLRSNSCSNIKKKRKKVDVLTESALYLDEVFEEESECVLVFFLNQDLDHRFLDLRLVDCEM